MLRSLAIAVVTTSLLGWATPASARLRLYQPTVAARGDGGHYLVWRDQARLRVLRDGERWREAKVYRQPSGCDGSVLGRGYIAFNCVAPSRCSDLGLNAPKIMTLATGMTVEPAGLALLETQQERSCYATDSLERVGDRLIEFITSVYHGQGYYSWDWRSGHLVGPTEDVLYRRSVFDPASATGVRRLCRPLARRTFRFRDEDVTGGPTVYTLDYPAWLERPYLVTETDRALLLERCGRRGAVRLADTYTAVRVTRTYVAWAERGRLLLRLLRGGKTYRWRIPLGDVQLTGTEGTVIASIGEGRRLRCPCAHRAVDLIPRS